MEHLVEVAALLGFTLIVVRVLGPFASALAKRLEGRASLAPSPDPATPDLLAELEALQERVDFLERAIAAQKPTAVDEYDEMVKIAFD